MCSDQATLSWAGAYNLDSEVASYHIWIDEEMPTGSGNWSGLQEVGVVDANTNAFVHEGATFGATYKYHIVAEMASGLEILSNARTLEFSYPGAPSFTSLRRASVSDSGTVNIIVDLDPNSNDTHAYTLQRKRSSEAEFTDLETQEGRGRYDLDLHGLHRQDQRIQLQLPRTGGEFLQRFGRYVEHSGDGVVAGHL